MYIYPQARVYLYIHIYTHICTYREDIEYMVGKAVEDETFVYTCYVYTHICVYIHVYIHIYILICVCLYPPTCSCLFTCTYMHVHMYIQGGHCRYGRKRSSGRVV